MDNLNVNLSAAAIPQNAFDHNRGVLETFDKRTADNFLGIIHASGDALSRVSNHTTAWYTQWARSQDVNPIITTLAGTFNPLLAGCKEEVREFNETPSHFNFMEAIETISLTKEMLSEIELIKDSYMYRYGDVPNEDSRNLDQAIHNAIPWRYQRNPKTHYASQNEALSKLKEFCETNRIEVNQITAEMNTKIYLFIQEHSDVALVENIFKADPSLLKDKELINAILNSTKVEGIVKDSIKKLITDAEVINSLKFVSPGEGYVLSDELREKANARNLGLLQTTTGTTKTMEDAIKISNIKPQEHDLDEKH